MYPPRPAVNGHRILPPVRRIGWRGHQGTRRSCERRLGRRLERQRILARIARHPARNVFTTVCATLWQPYGVVVPYTAFDWCVDTANTDSLDVGMRELDIGGNDDYTLTFVP